MNAMLTEAELSQILTDTAAGFPVPADGPDRIVAALGEVPDRAPFLKRQSVRLVAAAASVVVLSALVLSALPDDVSPMRTDFASSGGSTAGEGVATDADVSVRAPVPMAPQVSGPKAAAGAQTYTSAGAAVAPAEPAQGTEGPAEVTDGARIVKTGTLTLLAEDGDVKRVVDRVTRIAQQAKGYVSGASSTEYGDSPSATITLRIPVSQFEAVLDKARNAGADVVSAETSGKDVTASYADVEAQITSLKAARQRFLTILAGARTIGETLTVQQRVDEVQARIDRLEGQRRVLADQSSLATLTVNVGEDVELDGTRATPSGLSRAWDDAKDGFTSGVEGIIARSGRALLLVLVGIPLFFAVRLGWRLARRRLV